MNPINNNNPINPIVVLPSELFSRLFHFLPLSATGTSTAINRQWRQAILSNSTLHTEVDLTKFTGESHVAPVFYHLTRLGSLSLNKLVKVFLNLNAFYEEFRLQKDSSRAVGLEYLFLVLSNSKETLRTLSVEIQTTRMTTKDRLLFHDWIPPFLLVLAYQFPVLPNLKTTQVRSPYAVNFKVGQETASSKSFSLSCNDHDGALAVITSSPLSKLAEFLDKAVENVGSGLTELSMEDRPGTSLEETRLLEQLSHSKLTLQKLDWQSTLRAERFFGFAMHCPRLVSLSFTSSVNHWEEDEDADEEEEEEEAWQVETEENSLRNSNLKQIELSSSLDRPRFDWNWLSSWISGSALEVFSLGFARATLIPGEALELMLSRSKNSTIEMFLRHVRCGEFKAFDSWLFPNLKSLSLSWIAPPFFNSFCVMDAPNLTSLTLSGSIKDDPNLLIFFSRLIKTHDARLTHLSLNVRRDKRTPSKLTQSFEFLSLRNLEVEDEHLSGLFSTLQYPELLNLFLPNLENASYDGQVAAFVSNSPKLSTVNDEPL